MWKAEHRRAPRPAIPPAKRGGRRSEVNGRKLLNAIFDVLSTGCQWKALPKDLPPKSAAHFYFILWDWDGTLERILIAAAYSLIRLPKFMATS
jgi:transposase